MREWFEQKRVRLADIAAEFKSRAALIDRFLEFDGRLTEDGPSKAFRYASALREGAQLPPVLMTRRGSVVMLHDGRHRCAAAVLRGRKTVSAVVFNVETEAEEELVGFLAPQLSEANVPTPEAVQLIRDALTTRCRVKA